MSEKKITPSQLTPFDFIDTESKISATDSNLSAEANEQTNFITQQLGTEGVKQGLLEIAQKFSLDTPEELSLAISSAAALLINKSLTDKSRNTKSSKATAKNLHKYLAEDKIFYSEMSNILKSLK